MATVSYTRTTVARNPQDTASPGAPVVQGAVNIANVNAPITVELSSLQSRGLERWNLTPGEAITITVS